MDRMFKLAAKMVNNKRLFLLLMFTTLIWIVGFISSRQVPVLLRWNALYEEGMVRLSFSEMKVLYKERKNQIDRVCEMQSVKSYYKEFPPFPDIFHLYPKINAAVCKVPGTGTVILPKIMNILDTRLVSGRRKLDLTQYPIDDLKYNINIDILKDRDGEGVAYIIIGRNPYDRILNHFIEEISVVSELNRQIGRTLRKPLETVAVGGKTFKCGFQVDFQEYVDFILENVLRSGLYNPILGAPIARHCAPCNVKYAYMFKQETLPNDILQILNSTKMTRVYRKIINKVLFHDNDEQLLYLDDYVTEVIASQRHHKQDCPEILALLYKLWGSLKDQGILHVESKFPRESFAKVKDEPTIVSDAISIIRSVMKKHPVTFDQRALQRQHKYKLYDSLNQISMEKIKVAYRVDFLMFGYDSSSPPGGATRKIP